jgi:hypothetical protein
VVLLEVEDLVDRADVDELDIVRTKTSLRLHMSQATHEQSCISYQ